LQDRYKIILKFLTFRLRVQRILMTNANPDNYGIQHEC
jgi:hypothetical protein